MKEIKEKIKSEIQKILFIFFVLVLPLIIVDVLFGQREHVDRTFYFYSREQAYAKVADLAKDDPSAHIYNETVKLKQTTNTALCLIITHFRSRTSERDLKSTRCKESDNQQALFR